MDCADIIIKHLKDNNFDGLCNSDVPCGCGLGDIMPCGENCLECQPAYLKKDVNCKECNNSMCDNVGRDEPIECYRVIKE